MKPFDCTASIVVYNNSPDMVRTAIESFLSCSLNVELHVVDNSPTQCLRPFLADYPIIYHFLGCNTGYGKGHNKVIRTELRSQYHLILNPDIIIPPSTIESLCSFMDMHTDIGIVCPKVLNEDGTVQFLNKRYPTVFDLFARRFIPRVFYPLMQWRLGRYEMKDSGYDDIYDVEFMTGSFMFCRIDALKAVDGFDNRYFMYLEDADLSRKVQKAGYRTVFYPYVSITHLWERSSHKNLKMTWVHIRSAIAYFNKWGWKFM